MESSHANKMLLMGLIGFAAGVLFAPDKGTVTREKLKQQANEITDKAKEKRDQAKNKLHELRRKTDEEIDNTNIDNSVERLVP
jgi:gas vesicle protein